MMNWPYPIAVGLARPIDRGRRCGFWVSSYVPRGQRILLDTSSLSTSDRGMAGLDTFPDDCLLVVITPEDEAKLRATLNALPYPAGPQALLVPIIDDFCRQQPDLAVSTRWFSQVLVK